MRRSSASARKSTCVVPRRECSSPRSPALPSPVPHGCREVAVQFVSNCNRCWDVPCLSTVGVVGCTQRQFFSCCTWPHPDHPFVCLVCPVLGLHCSPYWSHQCCGFLSVRRLRHMSPSFTLHVMGVVTGGSCLSVCLPRGVRYCAGTCATQHTHTYTPNTHTSRGICLCRCLFLCHSVGW